MSSPGGGGGWGMGDAGKGLWVDEEQKCDVFISHHTPSDSGVDLLPCSGQEIALLPESRTCNDTYNRPLFWDTGPAMTFQ